MYILVLSAKLLLTYAWNVYLRYDKSFQTVHYNIE